MPKDIFVNIRITDLQKSIAFYELVGFTQHSIFKDETAVCMTLSSNTNIHVMLVTPDKFRSFTPPHKSVADAQTTTEVMLCLSAESKEEVDNWIETAVKAGGK